MFEKQEVFRDHLSECLKHFGHWFNSRAPRKKRGRSEKMRPMADFFQTKVSVIQPWLDEGDILPRGKFRIKLMCYLDLHGYKVIEFERMPKVLRNFSELIGFGVLSAREAVALLQYKKLSTIYEVLFGKNNTSKDREDAMWRIWKEKREELEGKKKYAQNHFLLKILFEPPVRSPIPVILPVNHSGEVSVGEKNAVLKMLESSLTLLEGEMFNNFSDGELSTFAETILRLSSRLNALSSKILAEKVG